MGSTDWTTVRSRHIMPTHETLRSLVGLVDSEPEERRLEFIVEPNGDLFRTITSEDAANFYMENDTLPLDFNDIFEVNRAPSSFHGKIQATLGSIFQDCLLQNVGIEDKNHMPIEMIEEPLFDTTSDSIEPVLNLPYKEVYITENGNQEAEMQDEELKCNNENVSNLTNQNLNDIVLENGMLVSLDVVGTDTNNEIGENTEVDFFEIWNIFDNMSEMSTVAVNKSSKKEDSKKVNAELEEDKVVKEDCLDHNAWKCRLYRARRKRKLANASSELESLEKDNKRLKLTEERMLSNILKIRKYYIQSVQRGKFHINL